MDQSVFYLLLLRIIISVIGILGNGVLIISILHLRRVKTFEMFLLGLAITNFGEIMLLDVYDIIVQSMHTLRILSCAVLKLLNICGENCSIFFTVLISIYRYQKIHKAAMRIIAPIFMDSREAAIGLSFGCLLVAVLLGLPIYFINLDTWYKPMENSTFEPCPEDFFNCSNDYCPTSNNIYRYLFIIICHVLPLIIVTWTSVLIIKILLVQQKAVDSHYDSDLGATIAHHHHNQHEHDVFHRSTIGVLAAMTLFLVNRILYLILHLAVSPYNFTAWSELEFFITMLYTAFIPYVYGTGHNFFSLKHFMKE